MSFYILFHQGPIKTLKNIPTKAVNKTSDSGVDCPLMFDDTRWLCLCCCCFVIFIFPLIARGHTPLGSLRNDDGNSSENVTQKVNSRCFKLHRSYCNSFNLFNVGDFFQELNSKGLYLSSEREKENRCHVFSSSKKVKLGSFTS